MMRTVRSSEKVLVCETCGDEGFKNAFVYCVKCLDVAIHRYCLNVMPKTFNERVNWCCEYCKVKSSQSEKKKVEILGQIEAIHLKKKQEKGKDFVNIKAWTKEVYCQKNITNPECEYIDVSKWLFLHHIPKKKRTNRKRIATCLTAKRKEDKLLCVLIADSVKRSFNSWKKIAVFEHEKSISGSSCMEIELDKTGNHECQDEIGTNVSQSTDFEKNLQDNCDNCDKHAQPGIDPVWRGSFNICDKDFDKFEGFVAHLSNKACTKVHKEAIMFPSLLCLKMHPNPVLWPKSFVECDISDDNIALYFFPAARDLINEKAFDGLVSDMMGKGLAMITIAKNAELLIFTSLVLHPQFQRYQKKYYIRGVFRGKKKYPTLEHTPINLKRMLTKMKTLDVVGPRSPLVMSFLAYMQYMLSAKETLIHAAEETLIHATPMTQDEENQAIAKERIVAEWVQHTGSRSSTDRQERRLSEEEHIVEQDHQAGVARCREKERREEAAQHQALRDSLSKTQSRKKLTAAAASGGAGGNVLDDEEVMEAFYDHGFEIISDGGVGEANGDGDGDCDGGGGDGDDDGETSRGRKRRQFGDPAEGKRWRKKRVGHGGDPILDYGDQGLAELNSKAACPEARRARDLDAERWIPGFTLPLDFDCKSACDLMDFLTDYIDMRRRLVNDNRAVSEHWVCSEEADRRVQAEVAWVKSAVEVADTRCARAVDVARRPSKADARAQLAEQRVASLERELQEKAEALMKEVELREAAQAEARERVAEVTSLKQDLFAISVERDDLSARLKGTKTSYQSLNETFDVLQHNYSSLVEGIPSLVDKLRKSHQYLQPHGAFYDVAVRLGKHLAVTKLKQVVPSIPDAACAGLYDPTAFQRLKEGSKGIAKLQYPYLLCLAGMTASSWEDIDGVQPDACDPSARASRSRT